MRHFIWLFLLLAACGSPDAVTSSKTWIPETEGPIYAPPPVHPFILVAPSVNNLPMYVNAGGIGGNAWVMTPPNSSTDTQWLVRATGGGAGAKRGKGGGGAGGTVVIGLTNLPSGTTIDMVIGGRGLGSDSPGSNGEPTNGGDTTITINGIQIVWAMGGLSPGNSNGGGPGGDPTFADFNNNFVVTYTGHAVAGGDGAEWNDHQGIGGSSLWGGWNFGGSGGADGAGGGSTLVTGYSGGCGLVELTRVSN